VYGVVVWSDPVPFVVPSVVDDVPLQGWCHKYTSEAETHDGSGAHRAFGAIIRSIWVLHDGGG
jgi:hypothetical protein